MDRRKLREAAFKMLFAASFRSDENPVAFYEEALKEEKIEDEPYLRTVFFGVEECVCDIDADIALCAKGWKLNRISKTSLIIMRIAAYEMKHLDDIPFAVSINEAVELTKKFDIDKAPKFVNGVLNTLAENYGLKEK